LDLPPFLLDRWLQLKRTADPPIEYDLASSTGPIWTLRELLALSGEDEIGALLDAAVFYVSAVGTEGLRCAIAGLEGVDPDKVQVVTGASEALLILFFLAAEPGANVILPSPGFPADPAMARSFGIAVRHYTLRAENRFRMDLDEIRRLADRDTRLLLVNCPQNPTGAVLSDEEFDALDAFCGERGIQLVSDQVYHPIYHGPETRSAARLRHATTLGDFSKALCLSGLRIGWMIDHDPARRERYHNARNYFTICSSVFSERLAAFALDHREQIYGRACHVAQANLALLDQVFARYQGLLRWVRPRGGMTAFPWLASGADGRDFCRRLAQRGVLMVPGDCFGEPSHIRLGFAASGEKFPRAVERLEEFLEAEARSGPAPG
jgi:aspartate/methionine/tyrosine aminotransferase